MCAVHDTLTIILYRRRRRRGFFFPRDPGRVVVIKKNTHTHTNPIQETTQKTPSFPLNGGPYDTSSTAANNGPRIYHGSARAVLFARIIEKKNKKKILFPILATDPLRGVVFGRVHKSRLKLGKLFVQLARVCRGMFFGKRNCRRRRRAKKTHITAFLYIYTNVYGHRI